MDNNIFIYSKKLTGIGAAGVSFDFKTPADAGVLTGVLVTYTPPNSTVAAAVSSTDTKFAQGRLLVDGERNLNVPFVVTTYTVPSRIKEEFIPCAHPVMQNQNISGFIKMIHGTTPENESCTFTIHLRFTKKNTAV